MPIIIDAEKTQVARRGNGWTEFTLVDAQIIGDPALVARRWILEPSAQGPEMIHGDADQLLYVIRDDGCAVVNGEEMPLNEESVLWLEAGERYQFLAGEDGLELLQGYAPGD